MDQFRCLAPLLPSVIMHLLLLIMCFSHWGVCAENDSKIRVEALAYERPVYTFSTGACNNEYVITVVNWPGGEGFRLDRLDTLTTQQLCQTPWLHPFTNGVGWELAFANPTGSPRWWIGSATWIGIGSNQLFSYILFFPGQAIQLYGSPYCTGICHTGLIQTITEGECDFSHVGFLTEPTAAQFMNNKVLVKARSVMMIRC
jgi:hypothetical protein